MAFDTAKALKHRVVLLSSPEELLRRRALADLQVAAGIDADGFDTQIFDAGSSTASEWMASCGTSPFLSERRVAIVRHLLRFDLERVNKEEIKNLPDTALLILVADDEAGDDAKQQRLVRFRTGWEKLVKEIGGLTENAGVNSKQIRQFLKDEFIAQDRKVSEAALDTLIEMCGANLSRCMDEMDKLLLYTENGKAIQESHVREVVIPSREWNVFKLVDAVIAGNAPDALSQLRIVVGSQNKAEDTAMRNVFPQLSRMFRLLWQGKLLLDSRSTLSSPSPEALSRFPEKPNLLSEHEFVQKKVLNGARNVTFKQLGCAMEALAFADAQLKGQEPGFAAMDSLERMALDMIEIFRRK